VALVDTDLTRDLVEARIQGRQADTAGAVFKGLLVACLVVVLAALVALLISVAPAGLEVFSERGVSDFMLRPFSVRPEKAGVFQGIVGTVTCALLVAVVAFPMGVAAAVYLEEYAHDNWFTRIVNVVIRNLAGVPAIVYGLLGFALFVDGPFTGFTGGTTLLSTGLTLSILVLPIVVITSARRSGPCRRRCARAATAWAPPAGRSPAPWCCPTPWAACSPAPSWVWPGPWVRPPR
jgi:phosphate transport system permease protein